MLIQPKPYMEGIRLRHHSIGPERRLNAVKTVMDKSTILPKTVTYEDIDQAMFDWVDKTIDLSYDGKRIPTFKLFSNQRINEYSQTWSHLDEEKNIMMNFKTLTRDNNPQKGEMQASLANIPGNRHYKLFKVPVLEENGDEVYEIYSMRQPVAINFMYVVLLVCDKYKLLNEMNIKIHDQFKALECYLYPNGHPMPMMLDTIDDESEYTINDRKYYSQAYKIKLMGYVIREEDFSVFKVPSRFKIGMLGMDRKKYIKTSRGDKGFDWIQDELDNTYIETISGTTVGEFEGEEVAVDAKCSPEPTDLPIRKPTITIEEDANLCNDDEPRYKNKEITLNIDYPICDDNEIDFEIDFNMVVSGVDLTNILDFAIYVDDVKIDVESEDEIMFPKDSYIRVVITKEDGMSEANMKIYGYDNDVVYDTEYNPESLLDEIVRSEEIDINNDEQPSE